MLTYLIALCTVAEVPGVIALGRLSLNVAYITEVAVLRVELVLAYQLAYRTYAGMSSGMPRVRTGLGICLEVIELDDP